MLHAGAHYTWRALDALANTGNTKLVKAFIKAGGDINQCSELDGNGWNVLEKNINKPLAKGNKAAVALVEAGADVNKDCSGEGKNALYYATITNNKTILNMLKEHGAKLTPRIAKPYKIIISGNRKIIYKRINKNALCSVQGAFLIFA